MLLWTKFKQGLQAIAGFAYPIAAPLTAWALRLWFDDQTVDNQIVQFEHVNPEPLIVNACTVKEVGVKPQHF